MIRACIKGTALFLFDHAPYGPELYRALTRDLLNTQKGHIGKLARIWPHVVRVLVEARGAPLEGCRVWIHEAEWTPFLACVNYLTCGRGGELVNTQRTGSRILERHQVPALAAALELAPQLAAHTPIPEERLAHLRRLQGQRDLRLEELLAALDTRYFPGASLERLPLDSSSIDIVYSGGRLEHYRPEELDQWLREARRVLKPGGLLSPILDHRDHLFHFDRQLPFLNHYRLPRVVYQRTHGGPLLYHNRLVPSDVVELLERHRFQRLTVLRFGLPEKTWWEDGETPRGSPGLDRSALAAAFRHVSDADLRTAAAHYVFRRPASR